MRRSPLKPGKPLTSKKPMRKRSTKRTAYRASEEGQSAREYMLAVKQLPCCICGAPPPSECHHVINGRFGSRKTSDFDCIPLCDADHRTGPLAIHRGSKAWAERNGPDTDYIEATREKVRALLSGA